VLANNLYRAKAAKREVAMPVVAMPVVAMPMVVAMPAVMVVVSTAVQAGGEDSTILGLGQQRRALL
jgi:hypothetical protein